MERKERDRWQGTVRISLSTKLLEYDSTWILPTVTMSR